MARPRRAPISVVVDAGVAIEWYVPEVHEAEAKQLLDPAFALPVPELFFPEFGNIMWKKTRLLKVPEIAVEEGRQILELLLALPLTVHSTAPLLRSAYGLAVARRGARCTTAAT